MKLFLQTLVLSAVLLSGGGHLEGAFGRQAGRQPAAQLDPSVDKAADKAAHQGLQTSLSDFAWLTGNWRGAWGPRVVEQTWVAPKAGEMAGILRVLENDKTLVIELFSLLVKTDGIEFRFRHFTPELVAWESAGPTVLKLASLDPKTVVFENPAAGQPKRDTFLRVDPDTYIARSEIVSEGGNRQVTEIEFHREIAGAPAAAKKGPKAKR